MTLWCLRCGGHWTCNPASQRQVFCLRCGEQKFTGVQQQAARLRDGYVSTVFDQGLLAAGGIAAPPVTVETR